MRTDDSAGKQSQDHDADGTALDWVFLAMAHSRLSQIAAAQGDKDQAERNHVAARKFLRQVADRLTLIDHDPIKLDPNWTWSWSQKLQLRLLYSEASELIEMHSGT